MFISTLGREYGMLFFIISVFLIPHYIFGMIFLKTKLILKIILPFATSLISLGVLWMMFQTTNLFDIYVFLMFLPFVIVWEITYQILTYEKNRNKEN